MLRLGLMTWKPGRSGVTMNVEFPRAPFMPRPGRDAMRTLFLNPPSYDDFDGGAGSRYQAKREVWSFW